MNPLVSNIQRFCIHDGEGIRTTIFLKGCSLKCPWCANPENMPHSTTYLYRQHKCIKKDNSCILNPECPILKSNFNFDSTSCNKCSAHAILKVGKEMKNEEILDYILKDSDYYKDGGGVTFSGGEPLLQIKQLEPLLEKLKHKSINITFESSLYVSLEQLKIALNFADQFIIDMKILDTQISKEILGISSKTYLANLKYLCTHFDIKNLTIRIPLIKGLTYTEENLNLIKKYLIDYQILNVEIFSVHNLGKNKYESMNLDYSDFETIDSDELAKIKDILDNSFSNIKIIKI